VDKKIEFYVLYIKNEIEQLEKIIKDGYKRKQLSEKDKLENELLIKNIFLENIINNEYEKDKSL